MKEYTNEELYDLIKSGKIVVNNRSLSKYRFWNNVNKDGPDHPTLGKCWVWLGCYQRGNYGTINTNKMKFGAHVYSYLLHMKQIPFGLQVLHKCDNPRCVNPDHLFVGTIQENMADMVSKDRQAKGEDNNSILTEEQVQEIRRRYKPYDKINGRVALSREFGVSKNTIRLIVRGDKWKYLLRKTAE